MADDIPNAFRKPINKWWDGYNYEETIILDDFSKSHHVLEWYIKTWTDRYPITGEIKSGTIPLMHKNVIVTSNYKPE